MCFLQVGHLSHFVFGSVHSKGSSFVDGSFGVADDDVLAAIFQDQVGDGDSGCSGAVDDDFNFVDFLLCQFQGVDQSCQSNDSSSVLIVVEDGEQLFVLEPSLNLETLWSFDVLQVDSHEVSHSARDSFNFSMLLRADAVRDNVNPS